MGFLSSIFGGKKEVDANNMLKNAVWALIDDLSTNLDGEVHLMEDVSFEEAVQFATSLDPSIKPTKRQVCSLRLEIEGERYVILFFNGNSFDTPFDGIGIQARTYEIYLADMESRDGR